MAIMSKKPRRKRKDREKSRSNSLKLSPNRSGNSATRTTEPFSAGPAIAKGSDSTQRWPRSTKAVHFLQNHPVGFFSLLAVTAIVIPCCFLLLGDQPTRTDVQKTEKGMVDSVRSAKAETMMALNTLLAKQGFDPILNAELAREYPLGYCLFGITGDRTIVPGKGTLLDRYDVSWHDARILEPVRPGSITMRFPDVRSKHTNGGGATGLVAELVPRGTRVTQFGFDGIGVRGETITNLTEGTIGVIGLYDIKARFPNFPDTTERKY
jgi:hypothetical protein